MLFICCIGYWYGLRTGIMTGVAYGLLQLISDPYIISLPQMIAVGDLQAGDILDIRIVCKDGESGNMTVKAAVMDDALFWQGYNILRASTLELITFENTFLEGVIRCDRDGLLYTSIPQNGNWQVKVDGKAADIVLVGDVMVGVKLTQGSHTVTFTYRNSAFRLGWKITLLCAMVFCLLIWKCYPIPDRRKKAQP